MLIQLLSVKHFALVKTLSLVTLSLENAKLYHTQYFVSFFSFLENALKGDARVNRATGLCKQLVSNFSHSWKKKNALSEAQKHLNLPEHSLITECPTRWGSRQKMIARVLEQSQALSQVLYEDRKMRHLVPTWQDTEVLESVSATLHPLQDFTDALSGESYVSVSYLKPVLHLLKTETLAEKEDDTNLTKAIKSRALGYMEDKYSDPATQEILDVASFLDPQFKMGYIRQEDIQDIKARVKLEMEQEAQKVNCFFFYVHQCATATKYA